MKRILICAMAGAIVACGGGTGGEVTAERAAKMSPMKLADSVIADMTRASEMVNDVQTVEDAQAIKPDLAEIGGRYQTQMQALRDMDQSKIKDPEKYMEKQMESANALSGFMNAMTGLQARNREAANEIMPELRAFRPT